MAPSLSVSQAVFADLEPELASTRRLLERLPDASWDFRPHEKSFSLGDLASHTVQLLFWAQTTLDRDEFDAAGAEASGEGRVVASGSAELVERFDELAAFVRQAVAQLDEAALAAPWTLRAGPQVIFTMPRHVAYRTMCLNHLVHHRAQLALYLRLCDEPVPGLYGPSADDS
jgi:uncharacterized damage-inducible protein DinB